MGKSVFFITACLLAALTAMSQAEPASQAKSFTVFDNLHYVGKPDASRLAKFGIVNCNIIYEGSIWKGGKKNPNVGKLPDENAYKQIVRKKSRQPGPVAIDIEGLYLSGKPEVVEPRFTLFTTLTRWTQEAAPGRLVGWYGHGLFPEHPGKNYRKEASLLAKTVNAFFPSMYTFNDDRAAWKKKAESLVAAAHKIAPGKPVYFYIWPQYHGGTQKALQFLSGDYWLWQLKTAKKAGADGVVMWSSGKPVWNPNAAWWKATLKFLKGNKTSKSR